MSKRTKKLQDKVNELEKSVDELTGKIDNLQTTLNKLTASVPRLADKQINRYMHITAKLDDILDYVK